MPQAISLTAQLGNPAPESPHVLVYFISGNPGLIGYYEPFLSTLHNLFKSSDRNEGAAGDVTIHIRGRDLVGFADDDHDSPFTEAHKPYNLGYQIRHCQSDLISARIEVEGWRKGTLFDHVIVVGHSVGAYITLEIFSEHLRAHSATEHVNLKAAILLFPTIVHIARSPSGRKLDVIRSTPFLDRWTHHVAKAFVDIWPTPVLHWILRNIMGYPPHAAAVTLRFLQSRDGIWQAMYMGKEEMTYIGEEKWADELWEIAEEAADQDRDVPKFFLYFGKGDHWVAEECRDEFIKRRHEHTRREGPNHKRGTTRILLDEDNIPHAFCIHHSEQVAEKVKMWIDEILESII